MSEKTVVAHLIAKILANRSTPLDEVPFLMENVERALSALGKHPVEVPIATVPISKPRRMRQKPEPVPQELPPLPAPTESESEPKLSVPTLVRRADAITVAPVAPPNLLMQPANSTVRGVVQWFDSRTGHGTLRLPGLSHDLPVDATLLASFGISRLFKGQEIEAKLGTADETPRILELHLANAPTASVFGGGTFRDRHAKTVVVEMKREAQRRSTARAEAELLLPPRRVR